MYIKNLRDVSAIVFVLIFVLTFIACDNPLTDDNNSNGQSNDVVADPEQGYLGNSFTLPSGRINEWGYNFWGPEGGVGYAVPALFNRIGSSDVLQVYEAVYVLEIGDYEGVLITVPNESNLIKWDEVYPEVENITSSDSNLEMQILDRLMASNTATLSDDIYGKAIRTNSERTTYISWIYADRDSIVSGYYYDSDDNMFSLNLELRQGWNSILNEWDSSDQVERLTVGPEPSGMIWLYPMDQFD